MDNFDCDKYYETLHDNFTKNYHYYLNLKIKRKNPINIFIKKNNIKKFHGMKIIYLLFITIMIIHK